MNRTIESLQFPNRILTALPTLLEAIDYAEQTKSDYWEFAVELESLTRLGLTHNDFRWLVRNELVEHKREVTLESDNGRAFRPTGDLMFPLGTCFVLTEKGVRLSRLSSDGTESNANENPDVATSTFRFFQGNDNKLQPKQNRFAETVRPCWDPERRILTFDGAVVKHFKWAAENQEAILCVFEEDGWPYRIDDPLKPCPEQDSKRRLSDTIKCLNRKQSNALIHFRGDGTGEGVVWELAQRGATSGRACTGH